MIPEQYDLIIRGGVVVDGTGLPRRRVDVGIRDGKIARLAHLDGATAKEEIDATDKIVAPGIIDVHTHYDPQITFDPYATMSCYHGVTTVVAGNCGFSAAPCRHEDTQFLKDIFASVEDMDPIAMEGVRWDRFETFPEFLESMKGALGINFACYIGHSNVRLWVMGEESIKRAATTAEIEQMVAIVREAMQAGAAGFSSSSSSTQVDIHGRAIPSRFADEAELKALMAEVGRWKSASISYLPKSVQAGIDENDRAMLLRLGKAAGVPIVVQGIGGRSKVDLPTQGWDSATQFLDYATDQGAPIYSLMMAFPMDRTAAQGPANKHYRAVPLWNDMLQAPIEERRAMLRDPGMRDQLRAAIKNPNTDPSKGTTIKPPAWDVMFITEVTKDKNKAFVGRSIAELAKEQGKDPADVFLDFALDEDFNAMLHLRLESPEWRNAVAAGLAHRNLIPGTSDGGAHLAKDDGAHWSSFFLRRWVLDDPQWTLEEGVRRLTQIPAALMGLHERGTLRVGGWADIMIFDPKKIAPAKKEFTHDLPGNVGRWRSWAEGVKATIVNGQPIVLDGKLTNRLPGQVVSPN